MFITLQEFYVDIYQKHDMRSKYYRLLDVLLNCERICFVEFLLPQFISAKRRVVEC